MKKTLFPLLALVTGLFLAGCVSTPSSSSVEPSSPSDPTPVTTSSDTQTSQTVDPYEYPVFPALESEPDTTGFSISFKAPEGWSNPNLWAWTNEGGANAYPGAAWPGKAMESVGDGWYQLTVPTRIDILIINANQGTDNAIQTEGLTIQSQNVWFDGVTEGSATNEDGTTRTTYNLTAAYEAPTGAPAAAEYVSTAIFGVAVPNAWRTANVYGVDSAGEATLIETEIDSDGYMFMGWARSDYASYYVTDGGDNVSVNFSLRGNNGNHSWYAQVGEYLYDGKNEAGVIAYDAKPVPVSDTYHLEVTVLDTWNDAYLWAWNKASGSGLFSTWPGQELEKNDEGVYTYEVATFCDMIIISTGAPDAATRYQTSDLEETIDTTQENVYAEVVEDGSSFKLVITYEK